ncbi:MAG: thiopurine S-methyltransferase, partial [Hyphomicrobium sp.]
WQKREIGFHQPQVQPALVKHWPRLNVAKGARVLVPLCGKTVDMAWLADQGYRVTGAELSELAVDEFFSERSVTPEVRHDGPFKIKSSGSIEIWCGDFFALNTANFPHIDALYDRAALVAMPPELQPRYAAKLAELLPAGGKALLIGLDYNTNEMSGPPFAIPQMRVRELLSPSFDIELLEARDGLTKSEHLAKRGITRLEEASYLLTRRA